MNQLPQPQAQGAIQLFVQVEKLESGAGVQLTVACGPVRCQAMIDYDMLGRVAKIIETALTDRPRVVVPQILPGSPVR